MTPQSRLCRDADVLAILDNTSQRISYGDLIDSLKTNARPTAAVGLVLRDLQSKGVVALTDPEGGRWLDQHGVEPDDPHFQEGPMYVERVA